MMHQRLPLICRPLLLAGVLAGLHAGSTIVFGADAAAPSIEDAKFFEQKIRPLLAENCHKCHAAQKQKGGLRLDSREALLVGGESGPVVVPGRPEQSLLIEAVTWQSLQMPPTGKLKPQQIAALSEWIKRGAPWPVDPAGSGASKAPPRERFTEKDRQYWAFRPIRDPALPQVEDDGWSRNGIDRFIYRKLRENGLSPSPPADRETLIRRITFDLTGLPPTPEQINAFVHDDSPGAWERLIDRLLESPHYGERWGRHWLDLVRYAESDGYKQDAYRPNAWRYREYVVRAFNEDKPYDRFIMEQLAGDEIAPEDPDAIVATGFLRLGIYEYNQRDVRTQWHAMLNEITDVTADVFLALGMSCARCHNHKFDPLLQEDYYRLQAFFSPILLCNDVPAAAPEQIARYEAKLAEWNKATAEIRRQIAEIEAPVRKRIAEAAITKFPDDIEAMIRKPVEQRTAYEHQLAELALRQVGAESGTIESNIKDKQAKARWKALREKLKQFDHLKPDPLPLARAVCDVSMAPPPTYIAGRERRGPIEPGFLSVLDPAPARIEPPPDGLHSTGRRTTLARWIANPENPLTARVMVNRIWQHHFGEGLVATESDFGRLGQPPSHPELLDWLASRFIQSGWSIKAMHRLMLNSATYRQQAVGTGAETASMKDPQNRLLGRMPIRRLDADQIRDAVLAVTGELKLKVGGPSVDADVPRRAIYIKKLRNKPESLLKAFDAPAGFASVDQRPTTTTPSQALLMINGQWMLERAGALARRLTNEQPDDEPAELITRAYRLLFGRPPTPQQLAACLEFLETHPDHSNETEQSGDSLTPLGDLCHVLLNSNEFLYVE